MIVTSVDIEEFRKELDTYEDETKWLHLIDEAIADHGHSDPDVVARFVVGGLTQQQRARMPFGHDRGDILKALHQRPQLLIPCGFDEIRIEPTRTNELLRALRVAMTETGDDPGAELPGAFESIRPVLEVSLGLRCREASTGRWLRSQGFDFRSQCLLFQTEQRGDRSIAIALRGILEKCEQVLTGASHPAAILLPNLWYPPRVAPRLQLADTTLDLLHALGSERVQLSDLTWQQFEDVVAELLKRRGLEVHSTPRSRDGGRDIIARGELLPGEPTVLAIEIKHKAVVGIDDVRSRLYANREFPLLMLATSGRFTAGVVMEKRRPENFLRLILKDGGAIQDWITSTNG